MKKLTDVKGSATLDAFVDIQGEENITSKGNLKGMVTDEKELEENINSIYDFWQTKGFPLYSTDETWRKQKMSKLRAVDCKNLLTQDKVIKPHQEGLSLAWSYMPHSFAIRCGKMRTPMEIYESEEHFKKGIKKLLTGSFFGKMSVDDLKPVSYDLMGAETYRSVDRRPVL